MATFIFDFDDTLFDTKKLKKNILQSFQRSGFSIFEIEKSYKEIISKENYSFEKHLAKLKKVNTKIDSKKVLKDLYKILDKNYVFPGVPKMLEKLHKTKKHKIILLTKGDTRYQKSKIKASNLANFFKKNIHITEVNKIKALKKIKTGSPVYFINDKKKENQEIKKYFPDFNYLLISPRNPSTKIIGQI